MRHLPDCYYKTPIGRNLLASRGRFFVGARGPEIRVNVSSLPSPETCGSEIVKLLRDYVRLNGLIPGL